VTWPAHVVVNAAGEGGACGEGGSWGEAGAWSEGSGERGDDGSTGVDVRGSKGAGGEPASNEGC
jgi:hypothetical protein